MDNNHHNHVFDPALTHSALEEEKRQQLAQALNHSNHETPSAANNSGAATTEGAPVKRRPGRPKGSTKKNLLASGSPAPPKIKRPVGRPRKDGFPAGSVGPKVKKERTAVQQVPMVQYGAPIPGVGYPPMAFGYAPIPPAGVPPPPPIFHLDPSLAAPEGDDWAELARTNPNAFLSSLLTALAAPNPVSSAGPSVEEAFKSHLVSLQPNPQQMQPIPSLYSILKTFWLPSSPAYFSLTASASTARTPSEHRFLYWDPQPLVFNGIACPNCSAPLLNKGRISSGPVKIYDIEKPFFIIGCEYVCRSPVCIAATPSSDGRKFASTDYSILRSLPMLLKDEFPARLLNGEADAGSGPNVWNWKAMGVSTGLWNLVMSGLKCGLRKEVILRMVWAVQHKMPEMPLENGIAPGVGPQQPQQQQAGEHQGHQGEHGKMEEDEEDEGDGEENEHDADVDHTMASTTNQPPQPQSQSQTLSSNAFSDAFSNAWRENTAMADSTTHVNGASTSAPAPPSQVHSPMRKPATPAQSVAGSVTSPPPHAATPVVPSSSSPQRHEQHQHQPQAQPQPQQQPQQTLQPPTMAAGFNPYPAYSFAPYAYMPHQFVNGQFVPVGVPSSSTMTMPMSVNNTTSNGFAPSTPVPNASPAPVVGSSPIPVVASQQASGVGVGVPVPPPPPPAGGTPISGPKRSPRHCCKCGSQECKGKGGRSFCTNGCQDCGKLECKGRNSRRPDKKCSEGWS